MHIFFVAAYPVLAHLAVVGDLSWMRGAALTALAAGVLYGGLQRKSPLAWGLFAVVASICLLSVPLGFSLYFLYIPPVVIPLLFWTVFTQSLLPGNVALVTAIGEQSRGPLDKPMRNYTRRVTIIWSILLGCMVLWSALLPWLGSVQLWSLFANVINYVLIAAMFVGEFAYRRWRFKSHDHPSFLQYLKIVIHADPRQQHKRAG